MLDYPERCHRAHCWPSRRFSCRSELAAVNPRYQLVQLCIELPDLISDVLKCMSDPQRRVDLRLVRARF